MTRSKSRRTRRNRRRRGGKTGKKKPIAPNTPPFAGNLVDPNWITAENHLTDLTTPGGCAMMLGKRGTLYGRSGFGGEYGKIAASKMNGYDGKTNNKVAMMKFNLGCDKGNGESQVILANERMGDKRKDYGIDDVNISEKKLMELFKSFDWATRKKFLEEGTQNMRENEKFKNFAVAAVPAGAAAAVDTGVRLDHGNAALGGSRRRRRKKSRRKRKKSRKRRRRR